MRTITITMEGGVIQDIDMPADTKVIVLDYDDYGDPADMVLENGELCYKTIWTNQTIIEDHKTDPASFNRRVKE